jgi:hypothetical protein
MQFRNQPISEEADRRIDLPGIQIPSPTHRTKNLEISKLIDFFPENICQLSSRREFVEGSGIAPDLFEAAIDFIEDTGYWEPNELLGQSVSRQWQTRKPHSYGALAVFRNEDSSLWQAKPKNPRIDKKGKVQRYEAPVGNGSRAFLPVIPPEIRAKISQRYQVMVPSIGSFWTWLENHPEIPVILTEGGKKSLSLLSQGYVAIALYGAYAGVLKWETIAGEKVRRLKSELIGDLNRFAHPHRQWSIALDQDSNLKTHYKVQGAIGDLAFHLEQARGKVSIVQWHGQNGRCKGVDDLIVNAGVEAWERALEEAIPASEWRVSRKLARAVRRMPDLHLGNREFKEVAATLHTSGLLALHGGKGTTKSEAIAVIVKGRTWLSLTALRSVGRDQAATFGGVFVNDGDRYGNRLLDENGRPVNGGSVCIPSLLKVQRVAADVLILDETTAIAEFLLISKLANKDGIRSLLLAEFIRRVKKAKLVILADADLSEEVIQWIESIRGERCYLVRSDRKALTYQAFIIDGTRNEAIAMLQKRAEGLANDNLIYINSDKKTETETLANLLGHDQCLVINSSTSSEASQSSFLASKGRDIPTLIKRGIRFIISSPSVCQGFSINHGTEFIDSVWGFYSGCSITAHSMAQGLDRVRNSTIPRFISVANRGSAYSQLSKAQSLGAFLKEFKQLNTTAARLVRQTLTPEATSVVDAIDWQGANLKMLASLEVRRNQGMKEMRHTLIALLKHEGKSVKTIQPTVTKEQAKLAGTAIKEAANALKEAHHKAVISAETITSEQAKHLSENPEMLSPDQILSLEKFYIAEFYRLEEVAVSDVALDCNGRTRSQVRALEAVLAIDVANETTARTINQNPENPQDWNLIALKVWLLEQSGSAALIRAIVAGEVESLDSEQVAQIAAFIRAHEPEFRLAFKFRNVATLSDQQILGEILSRHGIKTKRRGNKNNLRYEVCKPELEAILAIVERRKTANSFAAPEGIASPLDQEVNQRDAIPAKLPQTLEKWLTPESLNEIREQWKLADCPESQAALRQVIPIEVLDRAIS